MNRIQKAYLTLSFLVMFFIIFVVITSACGIVLNGIFSTVKDIAIPVRVYHDSQDSSTIDK